MSKRQFTDDGGKDLPVGLHQPCKLVSVKLHSPDEKLLLKYPDMKPAWVFRFVLFKPSDAELHGASSVCFCSDTVSKLGKLFQMVTDMNNGEPPTEFDDQQFVGSWFACQVREKQQSGKKHVATVFPVPRPANAPEDFGESKSKDGDSTAARPSSPPSAATRDAAAASVRQMREDLAETSSDGETDEIPF